MTGSPDYHILTVSRSSGPARVLVSCQLIDRAPWLPHALRRIVRASQDSWPPSVIVMGADERPPMLATTPVLWIPDRTFYRGAWMRRRRLLWLLFDKPFHVEETELAIALHNQLASDGLDRQQPELAGILSRVMFGPDAGMALRTARFLALVSALFVPTVLYYGVLKARAVCFPRDRRVLRDLASFQYFYSLNKGLKRTKARLLAAGDLSAHFERFVP